MGIGLKPPRPPSNQAWVPHQDVPGGCKCRVAEEGRSDSVSLGERKSRGAGGWTTFRSHTPAPSSCRSRTAKHLFSRLKFSNHGLNMEYWKVWDSTPMEKARIWILPIDKVYGRAQKTGCLHTLKYRVTDMGHTPEKADPRHSGETVEAGVNVPERRPTPK